MMLVLLGIPGAGKGTQAKRLAEKFDILHVSSGNILRKEIKDKSELGKRAVKFVESGKLVPDQLIIEVIKDIICSKDSENGFLMDGFPRNLEQAKLFTRMLENLGKSIDKVVDISIDKHEAIKRLDNRMTCSVCQLVSSFDHSVNRDNSSCPACGGEFAKRKDDDIEVINKRLNIYEKETGPLTDYYNRSGILVEIDGWGTEDEVTKRILEVL